MYIYIYIYIYTYYPYFIIHFNSIKNYVSTLRIFAGKHHENNE